MKEYRTSEAIIYTCTDTPVTNHQVRLANSSYEIETTVKTMPFIHLRRVWMHVNWHQKDYFCTESVLVFK